MERENNTAFTDNSGNGHKITIHAAIGSLIMVFSLLIFPFPSFLDAAEVRPDAGRILETIPPQPEPVPERSISPIEVEPEAKPAMKAPPSEKIEVKKFRITGSTVYSESQLLSLIEARAGKELDLGELEDAASVITNFYRKNGYLVARAYIPAQEIREGEVEIRVIEGRIDRVEIKTEKGVRVSESTIRRIAAIQKGDIVREKDMERGILLLSDLADVEVKSTLKPGATVGTTDLLLEIKPRPPFSASADFDNYGDRTTGRYRGGLTLSEHGLIGLGESFTLRGLTAGDGLRYGRGSLTIPVGPWGTRLGGAYSDMRYELGSIFEELDAKGDAQVGSIYLIHPFFRSRRFNLNGLIQYDHKDLEDRIESFNTKTKRRLDVATLSLSADSRDATGLNNLTLSFVAGGLDIRSPKARQTDDATARADGGYEKATGSLSRLQKIIGNLALYMSASGQIAFKNLDSSEKFLLGGPFGVRSYPIQEVSADNAYLLTGELRYILPRLIGDTMVFGFVDTGHSWINQDPWEGVTDNQRHLSGAGIGLNWAIKHFTLRTSYAWRLGPEKITSDKDKSGQFWIQAIGWF
jgi:hemolysin activation/secretion protein